MYPPSYDYHPILTPEDLEKSATLSQANGLCSICFCPVFENSNSVESGDKSDGIDTSSTRSLSINTAQQHLSCVKASYMVTPCHHIFHTLCLERWMEVKFECPVCRQDLPENN